MVEMLMRATAQTAQTSHDPARCVVGADRAWVRAHRKEMRGSMRGFHAGFDEQTAQTAQTSHEPRMCGVCVVPIGGRG
jgi:hypothetical protein